WAHQFDLYHNGSQVNLLKVGDQTHSKGTRVHLFTNGAMARNSGNTYAGGVVRDPGYKEATIQTDNLEVVRALTMMRSKDSSITLIIRIQRVINSEGQWEIRYIPRECNLSANRLAKFNLA
ncbi:hypothetical protein Gotur_022901, partial [Gossypium turneri]